MDFESQFQPSKLILGDRPEKNPEDLCKAIQELVDAAKALAKTWEGTNEGYEVTNFSLRVLARRLFRESGPAAVERVTAWTQRLGQVAIVHKDRKRYVQFAEEPISVKQLTTCINLGIEAVYMPTARVGSEGAEELPQASAKNWISDIASELRVMAHDEFQATLADLPDPVIADLIRYLLAQATRG